MVREETARRRNECQTDRHNDRPSLHRYLDMKKMRLLYSDYPFA